MKSVIFYLVGLSWIWTVRGRIEVSKVTCNPQYNPEDPDDPLTINADAVDPEAALLEAIKILENAVSPELTDSREPRVVGLYRALFNINSWGVDADSIRDDFKKVIQRYHDPDFPTITIYCGEAHYRERPGGIGWDNTLTGAFIPAGLRIGPNKCASKVGIVPAAYTFLQDVVICPYTTSHLRQHWPYRTLIGPLNLLTAPSTVRLEQWGLLSHMLVHELLHAISTKPQSPLAKLHSGRHRIIDYHVQFEGKGGGGGGGTEIVGATTTTQRTVIAYSFKDCMMLARGQVCRYARNADGEVTKPCFDNANSLALLALGLYFPNNDYTMGYAMPLSRAGPYIGIQSQQSLGAGG